MEWFIKKNATLPLLKMQVTKDGRSDYNNMMNLIEESAIFFSMVDVDTGIPKIITRPAGFVAKEMLDPNAEPEYYVYYQFTGNDTRKVGRYEGQFLFRNDDGVLILPIRDKLYINIQESFIGDSLIYDNCYVSEFPCCNTSPVVTATTTVICVQPVTTTTTTSGMTIEPLFNFEDSPELFLGRTYIEDERDKKYLINNHLNLLIQSKNNLTNPRLKITSKYWDDNGWWGNQKNTPHCVGYSWAHWVDDGPIKHLGQKPFVNPTIIYENAQKLDQWPGENYAGTSVRGGVKYLQKIGRVKNYYWAYDVNTLITTVLNIGPVVVGTNWYKGMFYPDKNGLIKISGPIMGGHAYVINGVDIVKKQFRLKNSWGRKWGKSGSAFISFNDMSKLISEYGEICLATEIPSK
jgi:hypothetical protein